MILSACEAGVRVEAMYTPQGGVTLSPDCCIHILLPRCNEPQPADTALISRPGGSDQMSPLRQARPEVSYESTWIIARLKKK